MAVLLALVLPALGEGPYRLKPGARGPLCLKCHTAIQDQMKQPSVHAPLRSGECADCHSPHASSHGKLLAASPAAICAECHADTIPPRAMSVHAAAVEPGCVSCHDPHASANPGNLLAPGNVLCYGCHDGIRAEVQQAEFRHQPVDDCKNCHDPHASGASPRLLKANVDDLCGGCHDPARASFVARHMGYPVAGSACTSCHDPHGSRRSGLLRAQVHEPVANRMCSQCHQDASSPDALATRRSGVLLCAGCHSGVVNEALARDRLHWPVVEGAACGNCHAPHASDQGALLVQPTDVLCGGCHPDVIARREASVDEHPPVAGGECTVCHAPHAADNAFLARAESSLELCGGCHDWETHSSHPIGPEVTDPRNPNLLVDCGSCHDPHGSAFKGLTHLDPGGALCVQCHQQMTR
jgi:predicted CXXCH cytochrome family protein